MKLIPEYVLPKNYIFQKYTNEYGDLRLKKLYTQSTIFLILICISFFDQRVLAETFRFQEGDILFQESRSSNAKAVKIATNSKYTNLGIILKYKGKFVVLESNGNVRKTDLNKFIKRGVNSWYLVKRFKNYKDVMTEENLIKLRENSNTYMGRPYDLYYGWGDEKLYSAELIWKFLKDSLGIEIAPLKKMKDYDLSNPYVKLILSQKFGKDIPLEETVISPKDILESVLLETVFPRVDVQESAGESAPENPSLEEPVP